MVEPPGIEPGCGVTNNRYFSGHVEAYRPHDLRQHSLHNGGVLSIIKIVKNFPHLIQGISALILPASPFSAPAP